MASEQHDGAMPDIRTQLYILGMIRCTEAMAWTSIFSYVYFMIGAFDGVKEDQIPLYAGLLIAVFTFCEFLSGMLWAKLADVIGRRWSLLLGCIGCMVTALTFGIASSLWLALLSRAIGGLSNPNVGVVNTCVGELAANKKTQARAFSIIPFFRSLGNILGPVLGGFLAEPNKRFPEVFSQNIWRLYPFLLPNLAISFLAVLGFLLGLLFLRETHPGFLDRRSLYDKIASRTLDVQYSSVARGDYQEAEELERLGEDQRMDPDDGEASIPKAPADAETRRDLGREHLVIQVKGVITTQVWLQITSVCSLAYHKVSSDVIIPTFLALPAKGRPESIRIQARGPGAEGGFGLDAREIGLILFSQAIVAIAAQAWLIPNLVARFGALRTYKWILRGYPVLYILTPFTAQLVSPLSVVAVSADLWLKVVASSTAYVCSNILITNTTPDRMSLAKVNGVAASLGCLARAIGPSLSGQILTWSMKSHHLELAFWALSLVALAGTAESFFLRDQP